MTPPSGEMSAPKAAVVIRQVEVQAPKPKAPNPTVVSKQPAVRLESIRKVEVTPPATAEVTPVITPQDKAEITKTASEGIIGDARRALHLLAARVEDSMLKKGENSQLKRQLKVLKESKNPQDRALAINFEIAQQQLKLAEIEGKITEYKNMLSKAEAPAEKELYETTIKQLELQRDGTKDESGAVQKEGVTAVIVRLEAEQAKIPGAIPNVFCELAKKFGFSAEEASSNPIGIVLSKFEEQKENKKGDKAFFQELKDKGFAKDEIDGTANVLRVMRGEKTALRQTGELTAKAGGLMAALLAIFMWKAGEEKQRAGSMG